MKRLRNPLTLFVTIVIVLFFAFLSVTVCAADNTPMTVAVTQNADNIKIGLLVFQTIVVVALVITIIQLLYIKKRNEAAYENALKNCQKHLENENEKSKKIQAELNVSKSKVDELAEWQNNAIKADYSIQYKIDLMLAKNLATAFEQRYAGVEDFEPLSNNFSFMHSAIVAYEAMTDLQKEHVTIDMKPVYERREVAAETLARESERYLDEVYSTTLADRLAKDRLAQAVSYYMNLPFYVKKMMDPNCFKRVNQSYEAAVRDHKKYQSQQNMRKSR